MDTIENAIKWLRDNFPDYVFEYPSEKQKAYNAAIDALEKQVPMKPGITELGMRGEAVTPCGYCGEELDPMWSYCPFCGQRIKKD